MNNEDEFINMVFRETHTEQQQITFFGIRDEVCEYLKLCELEFQDNVIDFWCIMFAPVIESAYSRGLQNEKLF